MQAKIAALKATVQALTNKIDDLEDLSGQGSDEDRRRRKAKVNATTVELATAIELTRLERSLGSGAKAITPEMITQILDNFTVLLDDAANGKLGNIVYKAAGIFRRLVGGQSGSMSNRSPGAEQTVVRGVFTPHLLHTVTQTAKTAMPADAASPEPVEVGSGNRPNSMHSPSPFTNSWISRN